MEPFRGSSVIARSYRLLTLNGSLPPSLGFFSYAMYDSYRGTDLSGSMHSYNKNKKKKRNLIFFRFTTVDQKQGSLPNSLRNSISYSAYLMIFCNLFPPNLNLSMCWLFYRHPATVPILRKSFPCLVTVRITVFGTVPRFVYYVLLSYRRPLHLALFYPGYAKIANWIYAHLVNCSKMLLD